MLVPTVPEGRTGWRRLVTACPEGAASARTLEGEWLDAGYRCSLPAGALVVGVDCAGEEYEVALHRVDPAAPGGMAVVKTWIRRSPIGAREIAFVRRRLAPGAAWHRAQGKERPNTLAGPCRRCGQQVPPGAGTLSGGKGAWVLVHREDICPPRPEVLEANRFAGPCAICSGWVPAGTGQALLVNRSEPDRYARALTARGRRPARYAAAHRDTCPPDAPPGPPTTGTTWCTGCGHRIEPGAGHWAAGAHHTGPCPDGPPVSGPWWTLRHTTRGPVPDGQLLTVRFVPRPEQPPVPADAPGVRVLDEKGFTELIAVVLDHAQRPGRRTTVQVRPATWPEAEPLLAADLAQALDTRPLDTRFRARWIRERICGDRPWVAEITGRDVKFGLRRAFLREERDYEGALDDRGWRGVLFCWTLRTGRLYEASWPLDPPVAQWKRLRALNFAGRVTEERRAFLQVDEAGDVVQLTRQQAEAWLSHRPEWIG
ncbi:hypothetical protein [Kitasatospora sp. NPDC088548]|uniref:hypothetical protein n=1 Tax=Kitasatospora sp. NPDC088548 TaxID=3364075 RepID=UPI0038154B98